MLIDSLASLPRSKHEGVRAICERDYVSTCEFYQIPSSVACAANEQTTTNITGVCSFAAQAASSVASHSLKPLAVIVKTASQIPASTCV